MDKAIIYGTFEFLGFHFCNRLLERGCSVKGIHFNDRTDTEYLDEKRLEVGRNSNFEELSMGKSEVLNTADDKEPAFIIFPLYDLFMKNNGKILTDKDVCEPIIKLLSNRKEQQDQLVYLLPIQLMADSRSIEGISVLEEFLKRTAAVEKTKNEQFFYLPTIFGPWQPLDFLFQRTISNRNKVDKGSFTIREWILDAIYIEDALCSMFDIMDMKKEGHFLLESGILDSWYQCAELLKMEQNHREDIEDWHIRRGKQVTRLSLKTITPFAESLSIQKDHFTQITRLYE